MSALAAITLTALANALIYAGVALINGQLLPETLAGVYAATDWWTRMGLMLLLAAAPANGLIAMAYTLAGPSMAGMAVLGTLVIVLTAKALVLAGHGPSGEVVSAVAVALGGAVWVVIALGRMGA